jgi:hypothetical protein
MRIDFLLSLAGFILQVVMFIIDLIERTPPDKEGE